MQEFKDKVAVVTGGASGIGLAMARRFAREGMKLVLADIEPESLAQAVAELESGGTEALGVVCDVSKYESVEQLRDKTLEHFGKVHVLCNNAGVQVAGYTWEISLGQWQWSLGVNLWGVIHGVHAFVPHMITQGEPGHVVNTSSMAGLLSVPLMSAYQVTKHSVVTLTETLAQELKTQAPHLGASVLCPAFVQTKLHLSERNRPEDTKDASRMDEATQQFLDDSVKALIEGGKPPEVIADAVLEAIKNGDSHVLTHPEVMPAFEARAERIMGQIKSPPDED